jgi:hypothetical protein
MTAAASTFDMFDHVHDREAAALRRLDALAKLLDSAFALPIVGTRIGADALLNLVPGAGVIVAKGLSAWLVYEAHRLGVPRRLIARMIANVGVDLAISLVPVAGWVGDVFFRANLRNMAILREHLETRVARGGPRRKASGRAPITIDGEIVRSAAR